MFTIQIEIKQGLFHVGTNNTNNYHGKNSHEPCIFSINLFFSNEFPYYNNRSPFTHEINISYLVFTLSMDHMYDDIILLPRPEFFP